MEIINSLKPFGFISLFVVWIAFGLAVFNQPKDKTKTFSHHAAANKQSYLIMAISQATMLPIFALFTIYWLTPSKNLPVSFSFIVAISMLGLTIAALVPSVEGWKGKVHDICASFAYLLLPILLLILIYSSSINTYARIISLITLLYFISALILLKPLKLRENILYIQLILFFLFASAMWSAAYF